MNHFEIIEELNSKHVEQLFELYSQMWWAKTRKKEEILLTLDNSVSFGVVETSKQDLVGYVRVLSDGIKAYIFDVMVLESFRGNGLGKVLMNTIISHSKFENVKNFELRCAADMIPYYERLGFIENNYTELMPMKFSR